MNYRILKKSSGENQDTKIKKDYLQISGKNATDSKKQCKELNKERWKHFIIWKT